MLTHYFLKWLPIITLLVVCRRVEAWAVVGCWTTCSMYAGGSSIATRSNHNILLQYRLTCTSIYLSALLYYYIKVFVFVYYFYTLLDEFQLLFIIHKGYFIMWNSKEVMAVFSSLGCYFGFMQISAHKLKGTGALLHLANQTPPYWHNPK